MGSRIFGTVLDTSHFSGAPAVFQPYKFNRNEMLRAVRSWFVFYNSPLFTSIEMRIYSDRSNAPGMLIATSGARLRAEIITAANGFKEIYFTFSDHVFQSGDRYHFVPWLNGYTGTAESHVAWRKGFPDPVLTTNLTTTYQGLLVQPHAIYTVGAAL